MRKNRHYTDFILIFFLGILLTGCGGPLKYVYTPSDQDRLHMSEQLPSIYIAPIQDKRSNIRDVKKIGDLQSTVVNMSGTKLLLSETPSFIVREGLIKEFSSAGFSVTQDSAKKDSEYTIQGELLKFSLNITSKDNIDIALRLTIIRARDNKPLWTGVIQITDSRYAGASGDSRRSIAGYISTTLEKILREAVNKTKRTIRERPSPQDTSDELNNSKKTIDGENNKISTGALSIATSPTRAKVYLNSIYYGLSPQRLELKPGIYNLLIKKEGFFEYREKIAVDKGRMTEVEEKLRKRVTD